MYNPIITSIGADATRGTMLITGDKNMNGIATFQVYPSELKDFITKMNCFCYEEQTLKGGEEERYSLVLLVDPKVTKNIKEAIIQFVFFKK